MMRPIAISAALVAGFVSCQSASPKRSLDDYVVTPHGLVHRTCVRMIAPGERVHAEGHVARVDGTREELAPCPHPRLNLHTLEPMSSVSPTVSGWVEYAISTATTGLGFLSATWPVPGAPSATGATIFFFPGSEPSSGSTILQPVLQYGRSAAGGGDYWAAASWFCCPKGWTNHSPLINVNAGDSILGTMSATCSGASCNWSIVTADQSTGASTILAADAVVTPFVWNFGGVLEVYGVTACNQYPVSATTTFSNIVLKDRNGHPMTPAWSPVVLGVTPVCSYTVTNTANSVTVTY